MQGIVGFYSVSGKNSVLKISAAETKACPLCIAPLVCSREKPVLEDDFLGVPSCSRRSRAMYLNIAKKVVDTPCTICYIRCMAVLNMRNIPDRLKNDFKAYCAKQGKTMQEVILAFMRRAVAKEAKRK